MIVDLLCDLKIGYQGISYDKTVAEAFTKAATDSLVKGIVTENEFRAAAPLADYYTQSPSGDGYTQPIAPDTILPHSEGYRAEFSKNC